MTSNVWRAKMGLLYGARDFIVMAFAFVACGGSVTTVGDTDGGGSDGSTSADGGSSDASASCATAVEGAACAIAGETCSSGCTDPCKFCNILRCEGGKWQALEVPPAPCMDGGGPRRHPDARMTWQGPGGFAGTGPAIVIDGAGSIRGWQSIHSFDPAAQPAVAPDATFTVSGAAVDDLFDIWAGTSTSGLPHGGNSADCYAEVYVSMCTNCPAQTVKYSTASQVTPELNKVWDWFDANIISQQAFAHPRTYCAF